MKSSPFCFCLLLLTALPVGSALADTPQPAKPDKSAPNLQKQTEEEARRADLQAAAKAGDKLAALIQKLQERIRNQRILDKMPGARSQADEQDAILLQLAEELRALRLRVDKMTRP